MTGQFEKNQDERERDMKKCIALLSLTCMLLMSLTACGSGQGEAPSQTSAASTPAAQSAPAAHTHTEEVLAAVEPTCTATGLTEGKRCAECGEILTAQETVPALGHTTDAGTCSRCGQSFGIWKTGFYVDNFNHTILR